MTIISEAEKYRRDIARKHINPERVKRLPEAAKKWAALPQNIRAAVAKVAGVENLALDDAALSHADRRKMLAAVRDLLRELDKARKILQTVKVVE